MLLFLAVTALPPLACESASFSTSFLLPAVTPVSRVAADDCTPAPPSIIPVGHTTLEPLTGGRLTVEDGVSEPEWQRVRAGFLAGRAYVLANLGVFADPVCIDVRSSESGLSGSASATGTHIVIFTAPEGWPFPSTWELEMVVAHEYIHVWQYAVQGDAWTEGPEWLVEGAADLCALQAVIDAGIVGEAEAREYFNLIPGPLDPSLPSIESGDAFRSVLNAHGLAYQAVRLLTATNGIGSLRTYWEAQASGIAWPVAFERAFGMTPEAFYGRFASSRAVQT